MNPKHPNLNPVDNATMSKSSPGPWKWDKVRGAGNSALQCDGGNVLNCSWGPEDDDATLIASAPEMLGLLRELEWSAGDDQSECPICHNGMNEGHGSENFGSLSGRPPVPCRLAKLLKELP